MNEEYSPFDQSRRLKYQDARERAALYKERFYDCVIKTIDELPPAFLDKLENLDIIVADWPSPSQLARSNIRSRYGLLGLYEGVPHTRRGRGYGMVLPDKISVFRKPIEARCGSWREVEAEIGRVVRHEIAHHFGIEEDTLRNIEGNRRKKNSSQ
jgi:predicted Zn-dependent protease with MMP-like domain